MKILVTGGAGFIGTHLCRSLLTKAETVVCVDNLLTGTKSNLKDLLPNSKFTFIQHDVIQPLSTTLPKLDYIFHLASPASPNHHSPISYHALPMETMLVNTVGTKNMLDLALKHQARFLFSSSSEAYGDPKENPQVETYLGNVSTTGPRSVYDEAKRFGETLVAYYHRDKKLDTRTARIFNTYGPGMRQEDKRMLVNFILQALTNQSITLYGDGSQTRSLCYIDDLILGLEKLMFTSNLAGEIVNLGSDREQTVKAYALLVKELTHSKSKIEQAEALPKNDPLLRKPDLQKAKRLLDWQPTTDLETGLKKMINYFRNQI